ncbi:uncharacterized protein BDZ83DRAFT_101974 [Colletotrichum acutatum]|uniref:Uncharacterized protein n=1 Tax=Glomerella acutata TaxID=27357 RepID=A0AAD8UW43_GLOAC|nr:uncharacterized protein BDZ83DRAFT_101974 [Colletotrichum acutatum]KAK1728779.1 hypothetical protein BDZ83DRAFT_101974 [Colletotrichum acutatum]
MLPPHRAAIANETHFPTSFRRLWTNHKLSISIEMWNSNIVQDIGWDDTSLADDDYLNKNQHNPIQAPSCFQLSPSPSRPRILVHTVPLIFSYRSQSYSSHLTVDLPAMYRRHIQHTQPTSGRPSTTLALCLGSRHRSTIYLTSTIPDQLVTAQCYRRRTRVLILDCKRIPESLTSLVLESRRPAFVCFTKVPSWTRRSRSSLQPRSSILLHFNS